MKTLNEVIEVIENCEIKKQDCLTCPYRNDAGNCYAPDALHYLREYQRDKQIFAYDIAKRNLELSERNDPLSWDELRRIDEEPIWIEVKNGEKKWVITWIDPDDVDRIYITDAYGLRGILNMKMYFKGEIKAYRKERE